MLRTIILRNIVAPNPGDKIEGGVIDIHTSRRRTTPLNIRSRRLSGKYKRSGYTSHTVRFNEKITVDEALNDFKGLKITRDTTRYFDHDTDEFVEIDNLANVETRRYLYESDKQKHIKDKNNEHLH